MIVSHGMRCAISTGGRGKENVKVELCARNGRLRRVLILKLVTLSTCAVTEVDSGESSSEKH